MKFQKMKVTSHLGGQTYQVAKKFLKLNKNMDNSCDSDVYMPSKVKVRLRAE